MSSYLPASLLLASLTLMSSLAACDRSRAERQRPELVDASTAPAVSAAPTAPAARPRPQVDNVLFITVDALRADQPWTGYDKLETPHLSRLAQESVVYTRAYALANLTTSSVNALLASRYPSELSRDMCTIGHYEIPGSLAPTLKAANVETLGAHGHAIFAGTTAPKLGFDQWRLIRGAHWRLQSNGAVTGHDIAQELIRNIAPSEPKRKRFFWTHFVDTHDTYVEHAEHQSTASGERRLYDSEVGYTDALIGRVLSALEQHGLRSSTAIVVTGDHGEAFGEHRSKNHGFNLYEEEIHVPLILHIPGVSPQRIDAPRSAIDLAPTIAELLGVAKPDTWKGLSLLSDLGPQQPAQRPVMVDVPEMRERNQQRAVIRDNVKVIFSPEGTFVFDLAADPAEKSPLSGGRAKDAIERARLDLGGVRSIAGRPCLDGKAASKSKIDI